MTWNQLNDVTCGGVEDFMGAYDTMEFLDESGDDELWGCDALTGIIEVLEAEYEYLPADHDAEIIENQNLRNRLAAVR